MKTAEYTLLIVWAVFAIAGVLWACHRDAPGLLQHYQDTGGDDLVSPPGPGPDGPGGSSRSSA